MYVLPGLFTNLQFMEMYKQKFEIQIILQCIMAFVIKMLQKQLTANADW